MNFSCSKSLLAEAVAAASRAVSVKSTVEALECLLITAGPDGVTVTGYDLDNGIRVNIEATVRVPGRAALSARTFGDVVRRAPDDTVTVETDERFRTAVASGPAQSDMIGVDPADYPALPKIDARAELSVTGESFLTLTSRTVYAVATTDVNPVLTGVLFEAEADRVRTVALDRFRLAIAREKLLEPTDEKLSFVVPGRGLNEIARLVSAGDEKVTLRVSDKHLSVTLGSTTFICRLLESEFIEYSNFLPSSHNTVSTTDVARLTDSIERASIFINERMRTPVFLKFGEDSIDVYCASSLGSHRDSLSAQTEGAEVELAVNNRYMLDALKACGSARAAIKLNTPLSPIIIEPESGDDYTFLIVPVNTPRGTER